MMMKQAVPFLALVALATAGCDSGSTTAQAAPVEVRTINSTTPRPAQLDQPAVLLDEMPPPKPKVMPWEKQTVVILSPEDEKLRSSLPFTPAIAMDPIDGEKISIRATTPRVDYQGRIYYFRTEENRRAFVANPQSFLTGRFTKL